VFDLDGRVALVTGSSRGIGLAIANALADRGAAVAVHGRTRSEALEMAVDSVSRTGRPVMSVEGDLADGAATKGMVDEVAAEFGGLDILVNNAGAVTPLPVDDVDEATWDGTLNSNLRGAFVASQAASHHMRLAGYGRIINISSQAAEVAIPNYLPYGVSKAGLNIMTKYLAVEWAAFGITVNTVSPAFIETDLTRAVFAALPDLFEDQLSRVPKRRMGRADEVAAAVVYLASSEADFTTGEVLHVDGGYLTL
jgi:NAD(P)-dependent dehydrogenase (short-subunit alcohol dehydrogenase family)